MSLDLSLGSQPQAQAGPRGEARRPRVAAIVQEYHKGSHADKFITKLMRGYELLWVPRSPSIDITSLFIEHRVPNDVGHALADEHGASVAGTIREALTDGTELVVDGVVIVGDQHKGGGRPDARDDRGAPIDPRARYFEEVARVFQDFGRTVPVFMDKQLGSTWEEAKAVYELARERGIPLMAGSSIPVNFRFPTAQVPMGATVQEVVVASSGSGETNPYHMLEVVESMIERRQGFESGVSEVTLLTGEQLWRAWESGGEWSRELQEAAISLSPHAPEEPKAFFDAHRTVPAAAPEPGRLPQLASAEEAILIRYRDGVRMAMLLLNGYMLRRNIAIKLAGVDSPLLTSSPTGGKIGQQDWTGPMPPAPDHPKSGGWNFDHLCFFVEDFFRTGKPAYPVERTLLVGGIIDAALTSRHQGGVPVSTPHLAISYAPPGAH